MRVAACQLDDGVGDRRAERVRGIRATLVVTAATARGATKSPRSRTPLAFVSATERLIGA